MAYVFVKDPVKGNRANVRFSEQEYEFICKEAANVGETVPGLLKKAYFSRQSSGRRFTCDDTKRLVASLNRIGNNLNQITKKINSGFREGFRNGVQEVANELSMIRSYLGE